MHFNVAVVAGAAATPSPLANDSLFCPFILPASVEVTVVEDTCLEPDDLLPLVEPSKRNPFTINHQTFR